MISLLSSSVSDILEYTFFDLMALLIISHVFFTLLAFLLNCSSKYLVFACLNSFVSLFLNSVYTTLSIFFLLANLCNLSHSLVLLIRVSVTHGFCNLFAVMVLVFMGKDLL